jgi:polyisoprenoid-binding protein YceI
VPVGSGQRKHALVAWLFLGLCPAGASVCAEPAAKTGVETRRLDDSRSSADFEVKVLWLIGVHGRFGKVHGTVTLDRERGTIVADARIEVAAISMRNHSYEEWVKSPEFFDVANHPQIRFLSDPFPSDRLREGGEIAGVLSLRGLERRLTLRVEPSECPDAIAGACPVEANGTIHRSEFGMKSRRGTLSDKVDLGLSVYLADPSGAPGKAQ